MLDELTLQIGSEQFTGWKAVEVKRSISIMSSSFKLSLTDIWGTDPMVFVEDSPVIIRVGEDTLITGYIDKPTIDLGPEQYDVSIAGRCRTADLIDCSAVNKPGTWRKINILQACKNLASPFGILVSMIEAPGDPIAEVKINAGQSPFDIITPLCNERALLPLGDVEGNLFLTVAGESTAHDSLIYGGDDGNIKTAQGQFNYQDRFSVYQVKGQSKTVGEGWTSTKISIFGEAKDEMVGRYRPKLFTAKNLINNTSAAKRAAWEAQVRAGRSNAFTVLVPAWRQSNGELWRENLNVYVYIPSLRVSAEMIVDSITYILSNDGKYCTMTLLSPDTYAAEPKKIRKKKTTNNFGWKS